jgi:hypothetical protein
MSLAGAVVAIVDQDCNASVRASRRAGDVVDKMGSCRVGPGSFPGFGSLPASERPYVNALPSANARLNFVKVLFKAHSTDT